MGKTYTMDGPSGGDRDPEQRGVNLNAINELLRVAENRSLRMEIKIMLSMYEIYNESVHDLLVTSEPPKKLEVRYDGKRCIVEGLTEIVIDSLGQAREAIEAGSKNRR